MRKSNLDAPYSRNEGRLWSGRCMRALLEGMRVVTFTLLVFAEPLARLSTTLALLCAGSAGLFALTGPNNAPVTELTIAAGVLMLLPVLYYLLMRRLRP